MRVSRVHRLLRLITLLQQGGAWSADDLARELEVSRRTVFRDLNMLEMAHIPYYHDPQRGGYRIAGHFFLPPINLTPAEALAMLMLTRQAAVQTLPLAREGARAAIKLESALPPALRDELGGVINRIGFSLGKLARHEEMDDLFDRLLRATREKRVCEMLYISFYERKQIACAIRPLRLVFVGRAWYLRAHSELHGERRTFKLARIRKLTVTPQTFSDMEDRQGAATFGDAWQMIPEGRLYDVHVRFSSKVAANVAEVQWHQSQRVEFHEDGSADFYVRVDGLGEITWWVLGYGDEAEVVSPAPLRRRIARMAGNMLRKYTREAK